MWEWTRCERMKIKGSARERGRKAGVEKGEGVDEWQKRSFGRKKATALTVCEEPHNYASGKFL